MTSLFLSYRRSDALETVGRLYEHLKSRLKRWEIFYDHQCLEPGCDFPEELRRQVSSATVVLVIIGPEWLKILKERRGQPGTDHVFEEVRLALQSGNTVLPVLIRNATLPTEQDLEDFPELWPLLRKNGRLVRPDPDFDNDVENLAAFLDETVLGVGPGLILGGKYKLAQQVGEGGMGVVYEAVDLSVKTSRARVAVKMILEGMNTKEVLARFAGEKEALARMKHDHIAKVLDSGATPQGRPYFVMEYVAGEPITDYCDRKRLTTQERLRLFQKVCSAVQHAHAKGIVHRDIKPSNVLVEEIDGQPVPKVIDFGLAKALTGKLSDRTLETSYSRAVGTLLYMSPEQAAGRVQEIDTRTDVYSLGVLLYELLAGEPPFTLEELQKIGDVAIRNAIIQNDPPRPSTKLSSSHARPNIAANRQLDPDRLTKLLRSELEWLPIMAMAKEPDRRYETPSQFSEDIDAYLNHERTLAGKPTLGQRLGKYLIRNRRPVVAASLVLVTLLVGLVTTLWQKQRADANAQTAQENEAKANQETKKTQAALKKESRARAELHGKVASLSVATQFAADGAFADGRIGRAYQLLEEVPRDYRRWEWYYRKNHFSGGYATLYRHTDIVTSASISPDGRRIVSGSRDATLKLWDAKTGEELLTLQGHTDDVTSVSFSPDGRRIVSGSDDDTLKMWDVQTGQELQTLQGHTSSVTSVSFSPDGRRIVSGSGDSTLKLWDAETGQELRTLQGHTNCVASVSFSPDGRRIVSGSYDNTLKLWDAETGAELRTLQGHTGTVASVSFSPDSRRIVSGSEDDTLTLWDAETGAELRMLHGHTDVVKSVSFSPDGRRIVSGSADDTLKLWDAETGAELRTLHGHTDDVASVSISPDGRRIVSGSWDNTLKLWDAETRQELQTLQGHTSNVTSVSFSPDGGRIVSGSWDKTLKLWDAETGQELRTLQGHTDWVTCVRFSPDGRRIVSGSEDDTLKLWDAESGQELRKLQGHTEDVKSVSFSPDGRRIVSGSADDTLKLWDAETGAELRTLHGHTDDVASVSISPDGRRIVSGSWDNTLKLWDAETGAELLTLRGHTQFVNSINFSPDGRRIVSGAHDNAMKLWDAEKGEELLTIHGSASYVASVSFSPDGRRIVSGAHDNAMKLWDAETGAELLTLQGHTDTVASVSFSPDGRRIVSGAWDDTLKLWDAETGQELRTLQGHTGTVESVSFSPDGRQIASGAWDETLRLWYSETGDELLTMPGHTLTVTNVGFSPDGRRIVSESLDDTLKLWDAETGQQLSETPAPEWLSSQPKHPTKNWWLHRDGKRVVIVDLTLSEDQLALRRAKALFRPFEANRDYEAATDPYAKAFWKGQFALHQPDDPKHWDQFQQACTDAPTWRLLMRTCDLVLQRGSHERAQATRAWAETQLREAETSQTPPPPEATPSPQ